MKPKNKILSLLFVVTMLVGCGGSTETSNGSTSNNTPSSVDTPTSEEISSNTSSSNSSSTVEDNKPKYYKVTFKVDNRNYDVALVESVDDITFPETPKKNGYTFEGWYDKDDNQFTASSTLTEDIVVEAKFKAINYNINYDVNGGTRDNTKNNTYTIEDNVTLDDASKEGYTFDGWYNGEEKVTSIEKGSMGPINLEARYNVINHEIKYENTYGLVNENNPTSYNIESGTITFSDLPDRAGFTFAGWSYNGAESSTRELEASELEGDITLKAMWNEVASLEPFTYVVDDNRHVKITGIKDASAKEIVVPDYVYEIELGAFKNCTKVEKLTIPFTGNRSNGEYYAVGYSFGAKSCHDNAGYIPKSLKEVTVTGGYSNNELLRRYAFYNCFTLTTIVIGNGITKMESEVFYDCISLINLTVPFMGDRIKGFGEVPIYPLAWNFGSTTSFSSSMGSSTYDIYLYNYDDMAIGSYKRQYCYIPNSITTVTINNGIIATEFLGTHGKNIKKVTLGDGVKAINNSAFFYCRKLEDIEISDNIEYIDDYAFGKTPFEESGKLKKIYQDEDGFIYIGKVLYGYEGTKTDIEVKEGIISISEEFREFSGSKKITSIKMPSSLRFIGAYWDEQDNNTCAFGRGYLKHLKKVELNEGIKYIATASFWKCEALEDINFPDSLEYIGPYALHETPWYEALPKGENYVGNLFYKYKGEMPENTVVNIKEGTTGIVNGAFSGNQMAYQSLSSYDYNNLVGITFPSSLKYIGACAFKGCTNLKNVVLPPNLSSIGTEAFAECPSINELVIPKKVKSLPHQIVENCGNIEIRFEEGSELETICNLAIIGHYSVEYKVTYYLPSSVKEIQYNGISSNATVVVPKEFNAELNSNNKDSSSKVFYEGSKEDHPDYEGYVYFYSEIEPTSEMGSVSEFWHYDADGNIVVWGENPLMPNYDNSYEVLDATVASNEQENAQKMFDGALYTKYCVGFNKDNGGVYVVFAADEAVVVSSYTFTTANDNSTNTGRNPKSWVIYGSNDENCVSNSEAWTEITSVADGLMTDEDYKEFSYSIEGNTTAYKYYKIVFTDNMGSDILQLSEIELFYK